jgi:hypothetical protein
MSTNEAGLAFEPALAGFVYALFSQPSYFLCLGLRTKDNIYSSFVLYDLNCSIVQLCLLIVQVRNLNLHELYCIYTNLKLNKTNI